MNMKPDATGVEKDTTKEENGIGERTTNWNAHPDAPTRSELSHAPDPGSYERAKALWAIASELRALRVNAEAE